MIPNSQDERAVSPVIGVILMVAITVILAAVIGTFVLDLGSNVKANPQAGVSFSRTAANSMEVTITSVDRADKIQYSTDGGSSWTQIGSSSVGDSATISVADGDKIIIRASYEGKKAVLTTKEV